jgi:predicted transcriptional regulator YdeE
MKKVLIDHPGMILAGFTIKTGFKNESNTNTSIIFNFINNYFQNNVAEQIKSSKCILKYIQVPNGKYQKFTTEPVEIPSVVIKAWKEIWQMDEKNIGGQRAYLTDFEIYDHRAADNKAAIIDIYVGII